MFDSALEILRVPEDADPESLRKAYLRMVHRYPPEHSQNEFFFRVEHEGGSQKN